MKKRLISIVLVLALCLSLIPTILATEGLNSFKMVKTYEPKAFSDVEEGKWYAENVKAVYEYGLMQGYDGKFNPDGEITLAETAAAASRLRDIYYGGTGDF